MRPVEGILVRSVFLLCWQLLVCQEEEIQLAGSHGFSSPVEIRNYLANSFASAVIAAIT
jgi:hypothetical protein